MDIKVIFKATLVNVTNLIRFALLPGTKKFNYYLKLSGHFRKKCCCLRGMGYQKATAY